MSLLHVSISAEDPEHVAHVLAGILGGRAMPFPPFPGSWIAFGEADDGSAIEVYPLTHRLEPGPTQISCIEGEADKSASFAHLAIRSPLDAETIIEQGKAEGWIARRCSRGPFELIELWIENRLLVEVLDPLMLADYRRGMTMANWARMFDFRSDRSFS